MTYAATLIDTTGIKQNWVERAMRLPLGSLEPLSDKEIAELPWSSKPLDLQRFSKNGVDTSPPDLEAIDWDDAPEYDVDEVLCLAPPK